jgi:hypothetical protein
MRFDLLFVLKQISAAHDAKDENSINFHLDGAAWQPLRLERKVEGEGGTLSRCALARDRAGHVPGDGLRYGETKTATLSFARLWVRDAVETLENSG